MAALVAGGAASGSSGTAGAVSWANIFGLESGANAPQTLSGITGSITVSAAITGEGILGYILAGVWSAYTGAFVWPEGEALSWSVQTDGSTVSGSITVTNATDMTTLDTFTYFVRNTE
jgi:hypothetical protein